MNKTVKQRLAIFNPSNYSEVYYGGYTGAFYIDEMWGMSFGNLDIFKGNKHILHATLEAIPESHEEKIALVMNSVKGWLKK